MADALTAEQRKEFKEAFSAFDKDGDGTISTKELETVFKNLGYKVTKEELEAFVKEFDENGDGSINFDEFVIMVVRLMEAEDDEEEEG